ncbi:MAG TPA: glycosyltransferase family 4 protein [Patescibacteria group bacterium]|nr:glycosyltransferase family 4 protein [Patescibacteria group bacterium]
MDLSICLVSTELFAWGSYGGIGRCTRTIGEELVKRGVNVSVVVPQGSGQRPVEDLCGMTVYGFPLHHYPFTAPLYRGRAADVYHSQGLSWGSEISLGAVPGGSHVLTFQNPRSKEEWSEVYKYYPLRRRLYNLIHWNRLMEAAKKMNATFCQARYIIPKVMELYGLDSESGFLPNPVHVPPTLPKKSPTPTVCFMGRFDGEKRPELFFHLAERFPNVRFVAAGKAHDESRDTELRSKYGGIANLEMPGFLDGPEKGVLLDRSWVVVNTSVSECLPVSFLEAAAHGCAILSFHDPDGFSSRFGYHAVRGDLDDGLRLLLKEDLWRERGRAGFTYVSEVHETGRVIDQHLSVYEGLLEEPR